MWQQYAASGMGLQYVVFGVAGIILYACATPCTAEEANSWETESNAAGVEKAGKLASIEAACDIKSNQNKLNLSRCKQSLCIVSFVLTCNFFFQMEELCLAQQLRHQHQDYKVMHYEMLLVLTTAVADNGANHDKFSHYG